MMALLHRWFGRGDRETPAAEALSDDTGVPMDPRPAMVAGLVVIAITFGGFGTWAAVAELASAVIAPGTVKVSSSRKKVQHLEGGVVKELAVRNGDLVRRGQVVVRLDETRAEASYAIMKGNWDAVRATVARLRAERDGADQIAFPQDLLDRTTDPGVAEILSGQRGLFTARRQSLTGQANMIDQRIGQLEEEIRGLNAQASAKDEQIVLIEDELQGLNELLAKGFTSRTRILALEREAAQLDGERGEHLAGAARAKRLISEARLEALQVKKTFQEQVATELREREVEMFDLAERVSAAAYTVERLEIVAPETGVVVGLATHTVGGVIQPGETLMEIVPAEDMLIVEAELRPVDIDEVAVGLKADIMFTAFTARDTPRVEGEVTYVSADSMVDQQTGLPFYLARVVVPDAEVARLGDRELAPGMPADVMIKTGSRTPLDYLLSPLTDSVSRAWREQ